MIYVNKNGHDITIQDVFDDQILIDEHEARELIKQLENILERI